MTFGLRLLAGLFGRNFVHPSGGTLSRIRSAAGRPLVSLPSARGWPGLPANFRWTFVCLWPLPSPCLPLTGSEAFRPSFFAGLCCWAFAQTFGRDFYFFFLVSPLTELRPQPLALSLVRRKKLYTCRSVGLFPVVFLACFLSAAICRAFFLCLLPVVCLCLPFGQELSPLWPEFFCFSILFVFSCCVPFFPPLSDCFFLLPRFSL